MALVDLQSTDKPPLNVDRPPFPADWEQGEASVDVADLGLPDDLETELRGEHA